MGKKKIMALLLVMLLAAALSGCSKKKTNEVKAIQESGYLRVAVVDTKSRYTSLEGEKPVGVEPELAEYIAQALGCETQFLVKTRQEALDALKAGEADIALGSINASANLSADYLTSTTYGKGYFYAVTRRGDYVLTVGALGESNVGVTSSLDEETKASLYKAEGISLETCGSAGEAAKALKDGKIRAYICYEEQARTLLEDSALQVQNLSNLEPEEFVVVAPKASQTLVNGINTLISQYLEAE